jgi:hypothetical protein
MCQLVRVRESSKDADCEQRSITQQPQQMNLLLQCEQGRAAHGRQGRATARHVRCRQTHLEWVDNLELTRQSGEETRTRVEACDGRQRHHKILHAARTHKQGLVVESARLGLVNDALRSSSTRSSWRWNARLCVVICNGHNIAYLCMRISACSSSVCAQVEAARVPSCVAVSCFLT